MQTDAGEETGGSWHLKDRRSGWRLGLFLCPTCEHLGGGRVGDGGSILGDGAHVWFRGTAWWRDGQWGHHHPRFELWEYWFFSQQITLRGRGVIPLDTTFSLYSLYSSGDIFCMYPWIIYNQRYHLTKQFAEELSRTADRRQL